MSSTFGMFRTFSTPINWRTGSKIEWEVTAWVYKSVPNPTKQGKSAELIGFHTFRDFSSGIGPIAVLKPANKREDGSIVVSVKARYELDDKKHKGGFHYSITFPYLIDDAGDYVVDEDHLTVDDAMPKMNEVTGSNTLVLTGFRILTRDGTDKGKRKYIQIAPAISIPSAGQYGEDALTLGSQVGISGDIKIYGVKIQLDGSGNSSNTHTDGTSTAWPANTIEPGVFRLDFQVESKTFPKPAPPPKPVKIPLLPGLAVKELTVYFNRGKSDWKAGNNDPRTFPDKKDQLKKLNTFLDTLSREQLTGISLTGRASGKGETDPNVRLSDRRANYVKEMIQFRTKKLPIKNDDIMAKGEADDATDKDDNPEDRCVEIAAVYLMNKGTVTVMK